MPVARDGSGHGPVMKRDIVVPPQSEISVLAGAIERAIAKSAAAYQGRGQNSGRQ